MPLLDLSLGLGTSGLDDPAECTDAVRRALEAGYRHVDTAQMYENESAVGDGIAAASVDREEVVVATKIHPDNLAPDDLRETAHESLDRLGLDRVDLLYVHWPTSAYDAAATLPAFDELVDDGVTDHVGVSNFTPELVREATGILDAPIAAHQVECHPRLPQNELLDLAAELDHDLVAYSPLGRGNLLDHPVVEEAAEIAGEHPAVTLLAWSLDRGVVPIPKSSGDHVETNVRAQSVDLPPAATAALDGLADDPKRYIDPDEAAWNR
ncbi:aldo/keto reductase [Halorubrum gandharaense]